MMPNTCCRATQTPPSAFPRSKKRMIPSRTPKSALSTTSWATSAFKTATPGQRKAARAAAASGGSRGAPLGAAALGVGLMMCSRTWRGSFLAAPWAVAAAAAAACSPRSRCDAALMQLLCSYVTFIISAMAASSSRHHGAPQFSTGSSCHPSWPFPHRSPSSRHVFTSHRLQQPVHVQTSMAMSVGFMESLQGGQRTVQIDLGQLGRKEVQIDIPAGVQNGQQMLLENAVRQNSVRVNLVVQVRRGACMRVSRHCLHAGRHSCSCAVHTWPCSAAVLCGVQPRTTMSI